MSVTWGWRKFHIKWNQNDDIREGEVCRLFERKDKYIQNFDQKNLKERDQMEDLGIDRAGVNISMDLKEIGY